MGTSSQTILKRKAAEGRSLTLPPDREPSPARSGQEVERTVKCFPGRPCVRTRCEPGRLAVRPFRASQDFGGSIKMRPGFFSHYQRIALMAEYARSAKALPGSQAGWLAREASGVRC